MIRLLMAALAAAVAITVAASIPVLSQDQPPKRTLDQQEMMKRWMEVATPGKQHDVFNPLVGKWETTTRLWMAGPEGPAVESKGTAVFEWILGGRYLQQRTAGKMFGLPHEGLGMFGYDNFKKKYTSVWFDNMSTAVLHSEGLLDRSGTVVTFVGTMDEFLTGEHDKATKYVLRLGKDRHVFEIHDLGIVDRDKEQTRVMEVVYTRPVD
ncbi:MAG: DUF1579 domain-containing protein [Planctomycetes bacterium]|nr:DUF1579 domain-containing protein [Planctomycetota bacterium]